MSIQINTIIGPVTLAESRWRGDFTFSMPVGDEDEANVTLESPRLDDHRSLANGCRMNFSAGGYGGCGTEFARAQLALAAIVTNWAELIDAGNVDAIAEAKAKVERERQEAEQKRAEREAELDRRKEVLLTELMGERVNVRQLGYKTMRQAVIDVREVKHYDRETSEYVVDGYKPVFQYVNRADYSRTQVLAEIKRLDVKIQGTRKWRTVWEDGMDDLSEWDRDSPSLKPVQDMYDGSLEKDS